MKKKLGAILLVVALAVSLGVMPATLVGADPGNLLTNPSAETNDMTGWTHTTNVYATDQQVQGSGIVYPYAGSYFFSFHGVAAVSGNMSQNVGFSIDNSAGEFGLYFAECWYQTNMTDAGEMVIEFFDGATSSGSVTTGALNNSGGTVNPIPPWAKATLGWGFVPCNADSADFTLNGTTNHKTMCNVYYDELRFDVKVGQLADITPAVAYNPVGTEHTVDVGVGISGEDVEVRFEVTGDNTASGEVTTDTGTASFSYTGTNPGTDTITAYIDLNGNDTLDACEPSVTQTKYWLEHFVTGGGNIKEETTNPKGRTIEKVVLTFGGNVGISDVHGIVGNFQIVDHNGKESWHCNNNFSYLVFEGEAAETPEASNDTAIFRGTFESNRGITMELWIKIIDNGEGNKGPGVDEIGFSSDGVNWFMTTISGGNFQVHDLPAD